MRRWKLIAVGALLATGLAAGHAWLHARPAPPQAWFEGLPRPMILGHQGGEKEWPSNTMHAFAKSLEAGSDVLDMDLHMTRDKVLVLIHDTTVERTTDGTGTIAQMTWAELEKLDAAYRFSLDEGKTFPLRGHGIGIPRLEDVLTTFPDAKIQIEVKDAPLAIGGELAKLLERHQAEKRILLSSFDPTLMTELRKTNPEVASSATPGEIRTLVFASWLHLEGLLSPDYCALQVPLSRYGLPIVTARTVQAAHARGIKVLPWTIDLDEQVEICRRAGADGINTNLPTRMQAIRTGWTAQP